ncbi:MAG: hypothetical protein RMJ98_06815 [Myxococcales bacterium]|nr:hypothetical protein [Polyangiaceae bacterium]MDW8248997.1 hypothetical protein [Myxococcales bacterium]
MGLGAFAYLGITGKSEEEGFKRCKPFCDPVEVDAVSRRYLFANVSLGVGVVVLGAAVYLWFPKPPQAAATRATPWIGPGLSGLGMERSFSIRTSPCSETCSEACSRSASYKESSCRAQRLWRIAALELGVYLGETSRSSYN